MCPIFKVNCISTTLPLLNFSSGSGCAIACRISLYEDARGSYVRIVFENLNVIAFVVAVIVSAFAMATGQQQFLLVWL